MKTGTRTPSFAENHHLGCAYTDGGVMYAVGVDGTWGGDTLHIFRSDDLVTWECAAELHLPGWKIFNTGVCKKDGRYIPDGNFRAGGGGGAQALYLPLCLLPRHDSLGADTA